MSFQGADVSALDRLAQRTQQGADYARKIAIALKLVVAALRAMSWTGFAAAYAAYLENVVIPWVERTGDALERFANVLRMASAAQKSVSEDSPQISIPASAYHSPGMPAVSAANPPRLCLPETTVGNGEMPTVAEGAGAVIIVPVSLGATASTGVGGAKGPPLNVTLPIGPATVWSGQQRPGSSTGTPGSVSTPGPIGSTSGGWSPGSGTRPNTACAPKVITALSRPGGASRTTPIQDQSPLECSSWRSYSSVSSSPAGVRSCQRGAPGLPARAISSTGAFSLSAAPQRRASRMPSASARRWLSQPITKLS